MFSMFSPVQWQDVYRSDGTDLLWEEVVWKPAAFFNQPLQNL